jgi:hypothetical protein
MVVLPGSAYDYVEVSVAFRNALVACLVTCALSVVLTAFTLLLILSPRSRQWKKSTKH